MASTTTWELYEDQTKISCVNICAEDLGVMAISINKWWKTRYPQ